MNILLVSVGSSGDVHPFVGMGMELLRRGHRATLITGGYFEPLARQAGLEFADFAPPGWDYRALLDNARVWGKFSGPRTVFRQAVAPLIRPAYAAIAARHEPGQTVLVASSLALAGRLARDRLGIPLATVHLSPSIFRTDFEGPKLPGLVMGPRVPAWLKRLQFWLVDRLAIDPLVCPALNAMGRELGLPPVRRVMHQYWHSPERVLGLFPDWFGWPQPDWPPQTRLVGFPLYDERGLVEPPEEAARFLEAGPPPVVFTPGSANVHGREFFAAGLEACARLGRRAMLLTRFPEQLPAPLPAHARHFDFVPFSWLLPRAAAVVHHGGVGSTAQGFAAGIPQLLMPMSFDQFDNADRVRRLGAGDYLGERQFTPENVAAALARLVDNAGVRQQCAALAARLAGHDALAAACDEIERLVSPVHAALRMP